MIKAQSLDQALLSRFAHADDPKWHWLEQRDDPNVKAFLNAANEEADAWFAPLEPLADQLLSQHKTRRELAVTSLKTVLTHHAYWHHTSADAEYPIWYRHPINDESHTETLLDLPALARETGFAELGDLAISPDEQWLAWTLDTRGDEYFDLYVRALPNGTARCLQKDVAPDVLWAEDNHHLLYTRYDDTQRPSTVWCMPQDAPERTHCLFEETDSEFWVGLGKTRSRQWIVIETASKDTSECHLLAADLHSTTLRCVRPRRDGIEYSLEHTPGWFYILHNEVLPQGQVDIADETTPEQWHPWIATREAVTLDGMDAFSWGIVLTERHHRDAQVQLRVIECSAGTTAHITQDHFLPLPEGPSSVMLEDMPHFDSRCLRLREETFTTPPRWIAWEMDTNTRTLLKEQPVYGALRPEQLVSQRIWATAPDGVKVPVSLVMTREAAERGQPLPTLLYGYGAYGEALDPWFSIARLGLLEHGVAFAVAHVRGGGDCGEPWYRAGKLAHKHHSFSDFIAARDALVEQGLSQADRIVAHGGSAGGLLIGASLNLAPEAFCAAVLDVPFVDVLRTMLNPALPLTTAEYTEWGNPEQPEVYERIKAYSPLDNLAPRPYPALFIQGSWHDSRVAYWEPAKYFARIRELESARGPVLLRTDMDAGHGGASGRFAAWKDAARQDAFILWALDRTASLK